MQALGIAGYSGSGKTTLIEKLIPELSGRGVAVGVLKHAHHAFDIDRPGKDSHRFRVAGAGRVLVASDQRWAMMHELHGAPEPSLQTLLSQFEGSDLVLVEGYKREAIAKIEVHRAACAAPLLYPHDARVVALATDEILTSTLPQFDINNISQISDFIMKQVLECPDKALRLRAVAR